MKGKDLLNTGVTERLRHHQSPQSKIHFNSDGSWGESF
jgi:hypothetical protein